jgi:hypothetical protein
MMILSGCQNFGQITPEKAIAHALAANQVVAQCYADYQKQLDLITAQSILEENGLAPVQTVGEGAPSLRSESNNVVGSVPIPATPPITPD